MAFEEEFGSEISDSEAEKILTVGDAIKFIESKALILECLYGQMGHNYIFITIWSWEDNFINLVSKKIL